MIYHSLIITAGTSACAPQNTPGPWLREQQDIVSLQGRKWMPSNGMSEDEALEEIARRVKGIPDVSNPKDVSAEYSMAHALREEGMLGSAPNITLISTNTFDGKLAVHCVKHLLEREFNAHVTVRVVDDFNVENRRDFQVGLGHVLSAISRALQAHDLNTTCFAPIGGFKVMTSLAYLVGCFHGYSSMYLHEALQVLHTIPAVPVRITPEELEPIAPIFQRLLLKGGHGGILEMTKEELNDPNFAKFHWLFEIEDQLVTLNAMGVFLTSQPDYQRVLAPRFFLSSELKKLWDQDRINTQGSLQRMADIMLSARGSAEDIYHERAWQSKLKGKAQWHLYRDRKASVVFRATWTDRKDEGIILIQRVWTNHKVHDREAADALVAPLPNIHQDEWTDVSADIYRGFSTES